MHKRCVLYSSDAVPDNASASPPSEVTDWDLCIICQNPSKEKLQCPAASKRGDCGAGYRSFADVVGSFPNAEPMVSRLDEGNGILAALTAHSAKWHKSCRSFYCNRELERAAKRPPQSVADDHVELPISATSPAKRRHTRTQAMPSCSFETTICFLCGKPDTPDRLHEVSTLELNEKVRECAEKLNDFSLLALLTGGDLIAREAKYHLNCLAALYNRTRSVSTNIHDADMSANAAIHGIVFAQLVSYIEDAKVVSGLSPVFKLSDMAKLYAKRLDQLGLSENVHSTRLKHQLLAHFPDMRAQEEGRDVLLIFNDDIGPAVRRVCTQDALQDAFCLSRAAQIIRQQIFLHTLQFDGAFGPNCQEESVPKSLLALISMMLEGPNIEDQSRLPVVPGAVQISQLIVFNTVKHQRQRDENECSASKGTRHSRTHETPLPLYIGLLVHATTRKKSLVNRFADLGLSVSYDRVLSVSSEIARAACSVYHAKEAVVPSTLHSGVFTVGAMDNIDHNPSSTTAHSSFHGTGISLMQTGDAVNCGTCQPKLPMSSVSSGKLTVLLPKSYSAVLPVVRFAKEPSIPDASEHFTGKQLSLPTALERQHSWLNTVRLAVDETCVEKWLSWSAFHAQNAQDVHYVTRMAMLPLFRDSAASIAMVKHSMDIVRTAVSDLSPNQTPVMTADQPLYAIAKQIQWNMPQTHGEDHFVMMLGGLHIEMAALKGLGSLLKGSGWVEALTDAGIATTGTAESFLTVSHVRRCRHVHEVTVAALHCLQYRAYNYYEQHYSDNGEVLPFDNWCNKQALEQPQFAYWHNVKQFQLQLLLFIYALRASDFLLYVDSLTQLIPWLFVLDRTHYARWLSVHVRDMAQLGETNSAVREQFMLGKFTVKRSQSVFSAIAFDQAHEQMNKIIKGDGGIIGLTENERSLSQLLITAPETARLITEFQSGMNITGNTGTPLHHEQTSARQSAFLSEVKLLIDAIDTLGNPFHDDTGNLATLHTKDFVTCDVATAVHKLYEMGKMQYESFIDERFSKRTLSIWHPLKRNKLMPLFSRKTHSSALANQITNVKTDCALFSRLYISCQTREGNLDEFFKHENHSFPPSLSVSGELHFGTKSDLLKCLEECGDSCDDIDLTSTAYIVDGAAVVHMLKPGLAKTFSDYAETVFEPYVRSKLSCVSRLDIVWDRYDKGSLKSTAREHRGIGVRRHVTPSTPIPKNWHSFLAVNDNKTALFNYLSDFLSHTREQPGKQLFLTKGVDVLTVPDELQHNGLSPCTHEEADTRLILHAHNAAQNGFRVVVIKTVDTDVVVLALANYCHIPSTELWVAFGTGANFRYIPVHKVAAALGHDKCAALPAFHSITGCDTTSSFVGRGKKSAWKTWLCFPEATAAFAELSAMPSEVSDSCFSVLEQFVILLYDRTNSLTSVDAARKQLFSRKSRTLDNIPPTKDALQQHVKRASYQAGHVWGQSLLTDPCLPSPSEWGWKLVNGEWKPVWITIPQAAETCPELLRCGCKTGCTSRRCKCVRANLQCTSLCACDGECERDNDDD